MVRSSQAGHDHKEEGEQEQVPQWRHQQNECAGCLAPS